MKLLGIALVASTLLAAACGGGHSKVYVQGKYRPKTIVLGAGTPIKDVRWITYGGAKAEADGMFGVNDCHPTCAAGHITWEPTRFSVSYVGPCHGRQSYRLVSIPVRGIRASPWRIARGFI
jgi:hypothetical protein